MNQFEINYLLGLLFEIQAKMFWKLNGIYSKWICWDVINWYIKYNINWEFNQQQYAN